MGRNMYRSMCVEMMAGLGRCAGGERGDLGDECSVDGEDGETFSNIFLKILMNGSVTTEALNRQPSLKWLTLSFGGGSYLGVP